LIFKELARQTVVCVVVLLSAQKRNYDLLLKPCQAVRLRFVFADCLSAFALVALAIKFKS
ncbi:hypothetical protein, partial [Scleromatobacter humisilvae]